MLNSEPGSYTRKAPKKRPLTDAVSPIVNAWLEHDKTAPRKQRHSAVRIFERLRDEYDFKGSRRAVSDLVRLLKDAKSVEVFCPINHPPADEVQIDWGEGTVVLDNISMKVMIFCARSGPSVSARHLLTGQRRIGYAAPCLD